LLKYSAGQLSTLVNFGSADSGLDGQFSVGANSLGQAKRRWQGMVTAHRALHRRAFFFEAGKVALPLQKSMICRGISAWVEATCRLAAAVA